MSASVGQTKPAILQDHAVSASILEMSFRPWEVLQGGVSLRVGCKGGHYRGGLLIMCLGPAALIAHHHYLELLTAAQWIGQLRRHLACLMKIRWKLTEVSLGSEGKDW